PTFAHHESDRPGHSPGASYSASGTPTPEKRGVTGVQSSASRAPAPNPDYQSGDSASSHPRSYQRSRSMLRGFAHTGHAGFSSKAPFHLMQNHEISNRVLFPGKQKLGKTIPCPTPASWLPVEPLHNDWPITKLGRNSWTWPRPLLPPSPHHII